MKVRLHPTLVTREHSYMSSSEPWRMEFNTKVQGRTVSGKTYGWRLFHYISGGGIKAFDRTLRQDVRNRRQSRFLVVSAALFFVWLCLLVF